MNIHFHAPDDQTPDFLFDDGEDFFEVEFEDQFAVYLRALVERQRLSEANMLDVLEEIEAESESIVEP